MHVQKMRKKIFENACKEEGTKTLKCVDAKNYKCESTLLPSLLIHYMENMLSKITFSCLAFC